jgi:hypothetical protein
VCPGRAGGGWREHATRESGRAGGLEDLAHHRLEAVGAAGGRYHCVQDAGRAISFLGHVSALSRV